MENKLNRWQISAVRNTNKICKPIRKKIAKLEEKKVAIDVQIEELEQTIASMEKPILEITDGYTSSEVLEMLEEEKTGETAEEAAEKELDESQEEVSNEDISYDV